MNCKVSWLKLDTHITYLPSVFLSACPAFLLIYQKSSQLVIGFYFSLINTSDTAPCTPILKFPSADKMKTKSRFRENLMLIKDILRQII